MRPLTEDEAEWIKQRIGPLMPLVDRMKKRLEKRGYGQDHSLYRAMCDAYDALRGLWITAHYEGCGRGIGRSLSANHPAASTELGDNPPPAPTQPPARTSVPGPFYSNGGPADGPIRGVENGHTTGYYEAPDCHRRLGIAYPRGVVDGLGGRPIVAFRLVLDEGKVELEGLWMCDRRKYVHLGDGAELI